MGKPKKGHQFAAEIPPAIEMEAFLLQICKLIRFARYERTSYCFPLSIQLYGEKFELMVKFIAFFGGVFYIIRGAGLKILHILCTCDFEQEEGKPHFSVMNGESFDPAMVAAIVDVLG